MIQLLAAAAPYLLSAGAGMLGNKTRKTTPGQPGQVMVAPQYSFTEPRLRLMSDFVSDNISRIGRGQSPAYFDRAVPTMRRGMERGVQTTYFGRPGDRTGSVQAALEAGALAGTGSRPGTANVNKALQRYEEAGLAIEEFIEKSRMDVTQDAMKTSLYAGTQIPKGPDYFTTPGYPGQTDEGAMPWLSQIAGGLAQNAPAITSAISGMFSGGTSAGGYTPTAYPGYQMPGYEVGGAAPADYYLGTTSASAPAPWNIGQSIGRWMNPVDSFKRGAGAVYGSAKNAASFWEDVFQGFTGYDAGAALNIDWDAIERRRK